MYLKLNLSPDAQREGFILGPSAHLSGVCQSSSRFVGAPWAAFSQRKCDRECSAELVLAEVGGGWVSVHFHPRGFAFPSVTASSWPPPGRLLGVCALGTQHRPLPVLPPSPPLRARGAAPTQPGLQPAGR